MGDADPGVSGRLRLRSCVVDLDRRVVRRDGAEIPLTPSEAALLAFLGSRPGVVVPRETLLQRVWGYAPASTSQAIHVAVRRLRPKIEHDPSEPDHLKTVAGAGWVLELPPAAPVASDLVGRDALIADTEARLDQHRVVVLLGPGGVGKTRLARELCLRHGGVFCDLSSALSREDVLSAVANAVGAASAAEIRAVLACDPRLVVLDNYEQLVDVAADLVRDWSATGASLLLTTRIRPGLPGEHVVPVGPLAPDDAAALFVRRAAARGHADAAASDAVPALVAALEHNPLCIELAAGRLPLMTVPQLLERLADRFGLLKAGGRAPDRHATLSATLDWSWSLLEPEEQRALTALGTFRGGFTVDAAEAVIGGDDALDLLQRLADASLVHRAVDRLDLYVAVREYLRARLHPVDDQVAVRHGRYFAGLVPDPRVLVDPIALNRRLYPEVANLRAAAECALERGDGEIAAACCNALCRIAGERKVEGLEALSERAAAIAAGPQRWMLERYRALSVGTTGAPERGITILERVVPEMTDPLHLGRALGVVGTLLRTAGRPAEAEEAFARAYDAFHRAGDRWGEAVIRASRTGEVLYAGDLGRAESEARAAVATFRDLGDRVYEAKALGNLGIALYHAGRLADAEQIWREAVRVTEAAGDWRSASSLWNSLGELLADRGAHDDARDAAERALARAEEAGALSRRGDALQLLARLAVAGGRPAEARGYLAEAVRTGEIIGRKLLVAQAREVLSRVVAEEGDEIQAAQLLDQAIDELAAAGDGPGLAAALRRRGRPGDAERADAALSGGGR